MTLKERALIPVITIVEGMIVIATGVLFTLLTIAIGIEDKKNKRVERREHEYSEHKRL